MEHLHIIGIALNFAGSILLAFRVKIILDELVMAVQFLDMNNKFKAERAKGNLLMPNIVITGHSENVVCAQKSGVWLLVLGFSLQGAGSAAFALEYLMK
jgi:hypothetical protein